MNTNPFQYEKENKLKKLRSRVYSLIGFYRSRGSLNRGQIYALRRAADDVMQYDYTAYSAAMNVISQINYETQ